MIQNLPAGEPADLFITGALDERPPVGADYKREGRAIQALALRMADAPDSVLPDFVDLALLITGAFTAGLSLYEPEPAPGVFRWRFVRGAFAAFDGATTPRHFSPCGITLDQNAPILTLHPERVYGWIADAGIVAPEVLLVPLYLEGEAPLGTLWVVSETEGRFTRDHARMLTELAGNVSAAVRLWRSEMGESSTH